MFESLSLYLNDKLKNYLIFDIGSETYQQSIEFYKIFPNATIYFFQSNLNLIELHENNLDSYKDRIKFVSHNKLTTDN